VTTVDVPDERRVHVVAEQLLQPFGERGGVFGRDREHMVLRRP
jgi:hypothetical protein